MKKKTAKATAFVSGLKDYIVEHPQFRRKTHKKSEVQIQTELRPIIVEYLMKHFEEVGYNNAEAKANECFYWEGQEGSFGKVRESTFGARNYPDFIIKFPYKIAIEYKKSPTGSLVKAGIGQSILHTMSDDFDFVILIFHDESNDQRVYDSVTHTKEKALLEKLWSDFNVKFEVTKSKK